MASAVVAIMKVCKRKLKTPIFYSLNNKKFCIAYLLEKCIAIKLIGQLNVNGTICYSYE